MSWEVCTKKGWTWKAFPSQGIAKCPWQFGRAYRPIRTELLLSARICALWCMVSRISMRVGPFGREATAYCSGPLVFDQPDRGPWTSRTHQVSRTGPLQFGRASLPQCSCSFLHFSPIRTDGLERVGRTRPIRTVRARESDGRAFPDFQSTGCSALCAQPDRVGGRVGRASCNSDGARRTGEAFCYRQGIPGEFAFAPIRTRQGPIRTVLPASFGLLGCDPISS